MNTPRILKLFLDVHMGLSHEGLRKLATKANVKLDLLGASDLLMFLNKTGDKMKVLGAQGKVIGYLRLPNNRPIMREALQYIPQTFGCNGFNYDAACNIALTKRLNKNPPQKPLPPMLPINEVRKAARLMIRQAGA